MFGHRFLSSDDHQDQGDQRAHALVPGSTFYRGPRPPIENLAALVGPILEGRPGCVVVGEAFLKAKRTSIEVGRTPSNLAEGWCGPAALFPRPPSTSMSWLKGKAACQACPPKPFFDFPCPIPIPGEFVAPPLPG